MENSYQEYGEPIPLNGKGVVTLIYVLYAIGAFIGVTILLGIIIAYVKKNDYGEPWRSHIDAQISLFWKALIGWIVGVATMFIGIGWIILVAVGIYVLYVIIKGFIRVQENRGME